MANWNGYLFAFPQQDGSYSVGVTLPAGCRRDGSFLVYRGRGPSIPTGFPDSLHVCDFTSWMEQKRVEGFEFTPSSMP